MAGRLYLGCAALLLMAAPAAAQNDRSQRFDAAWTHLQAGRHDDALKGLDSLIADYSRDYAKEKRLIFCGGTPAETLLYMTLGSAAKKSAVAIDSGWCQALWAKGYILVDKKEYAAALPFLERAVAMAPSHAHYLAELGYAYQALKDWQKSYDTYARVIPSAELSAPEFRNQDLGRGWRGMGFALIEMGKLDEAEALFRKCLELDPNDAKAKNELQYIAEQRAKKTG